MYLKWTVFKNYCKAKNIQLLRDDLRFIERVLTKTTVNEHRFILKEFADIWLHELEKSSQNQNLARRIANKWLLERCNVKKAL